MTPMMRIARNPVALALAATLALAGCSSKRSLPNSPGDLGIGANNAVPGSRQDFTLNVGDRIFFDTDSASIRPDAATTLNKQAQWLAKYSRETVTIEGHADERGTREYNLALGARRAAATRDFLVSRGVSASRIKTISYGKERPVAVCDDISCWSQNRRAVTVVSGTGSQSGPAGTGNRRQSIRLRYEKGILRMYNRIAAATLALTLFTAPSGAAPLAIDRAIDRAPAVSDPGPPVILAQSADAAYRIGQMEEQIRTLNGRIEELSFQMLEMQEQMRQTQEDNEFRFQEIEKGGAGGPRGDAAAAAMSEETSVASGGAAEQEAEVVMGTLGEVKFDENGAVIEPEKDASPAATDETQAAALPQNDQEQLYHEAYANILSGDYPRAQQSFEDFITSYPNSPKIADAYFWLGEAKFSQGQYQDAAKTLLTAHKQFPGSPKAPDMLLKLGMSLAALDNRDTACATYREVLLRYPNASDSLKKKVAIEQGAMSC